MVIIIIIIISNLNLGVSFEFGTCPKFPIYFDDIGLQNGDRAGQRNVGFYSLVGGLIAREVSSAFIGREIFKSHMLGKDFVK
jgi:hypothetical protein